VVGLSPAAAFASCRQQHGFGKSWFKCKALVWTPRRFLGFCGSSNKCFKNIQTHQVLFNCILTGKQSPQLRLGLPLEVLWLA
jgi:hypothetical protein